MQAVHTKILGIETSCDDTAAAVVLDGRIILSNIISSQVEVHSEYGGIVPEIASRQHVILISRTIRQAVKLAGLELKSLDGIAVTYGPGLAGSLLVGLNFAKGLAFSLGIPFIGINHLEAHIYAGWLEHDIKNQYSYPSAHATFPLICLIASGGHTDLVLMRDHDTYELLGRTRDDAAGEAFDKAARILGMGFPGGPEIQRISKGARGTEILPRAWLKNSHDFSFSGIKTALLHRAQAIGVYPHFYKSMSSSNKPVISELAAGFQQSVVDVLVSKTLGAAEETGARGILLGGGVAANALLRETLISKSPLPTIIPKPVLCTDNGAMVAACGHQKLIQGHVSQYDLDIDPSLSIG